MDKTDNTKHSIPNTFVAFHYSFVMLIWKTYLEQHLSSELKKEKNKTEMDWTSVSKWKYRNRLLMACHLLVRHKASPSYCSHTYSYHCDQNTLRAMWLFSIWWQACRGQLGPLMAEPTMWVIGTELFFSYYRFVLSGSALHNLYKIMPFLLHRSKSI